MSKQSKDNPPLFYLATQLASYKYHALLMQPVWVATMPLTDLHISLQATQSIDGEYSVRRPRGLYGFSSMAERDKFCRRCNAADDGEVPVAIPVTVPNIYEDVPMTTTVRMPE